MKNKIYLLLLLSGLFLSTNTLVAQEVASSTTEVKERKNVIKTNLLTPFNLSYERGFGNTFSLTGTLLYTPALTVGDANGELALLGLKSPSFGYQTEARFYLSKTKPTLNGFYLGAFYQARRMELTGHKIFSTSTENSRTDVDVKVTLQSGYIAYGMLLGWQKITKKGFVIDFNMGASRYNILGIPDFQAPEDNEDLARLNDLNDLKSGVLPRLAFAMGFAF